MAVKKTGKLAKKVKDLPAKKLNAKRSKSVRGGSVEGGATSFTRKVIGATKWPA